MYGETAYETICQMIDQHEISKVEKFLDLGAGIGQVVLQVAALVDCQICIGIEKKEAPARFACVRSILILTHESRYPYRYSWSSGDWNNA